LGIEDTLGSMGIWNIEHSEERAAASARDRELPRNTRRGLRVGPLRRVLSATINRRRNVANRLRVSPVSSEINSVWTPCNINRRASSARRFSRRITSSVSCGNIFLPCCRDGSFAAKTLKPVGEIFICAWTMPPRLPKNRSRNGRSTSGAITESVVRSPNNANLAKPEHAIGCAVGRNGKDPARPKRLSCCSWFGRALGAGGGKSMRACRTLPSAADQLKLRVSRMVEARERRFGARFAATRATLLIQRGESGVADSRDLDGNMAARPLFTARSKSTVRDGAGS
jgi:hypothetical protein